MLRARWGDLPIIPDTESGIAALEREQITKPRPVEVEETPLYQPCMGKSPTSKELPCEFSAIDNTTLHTIKLAQHAKKVRALLHSLQQQADSTKSEETHQNAPPAPSMPDFPSDVPVCKVQKTGDTEIKKEEEEESVGWKPPPELPFPIIQQILRKAVAAVCAHVGFDATTESVLETLTDIVHELNLRICRLLRYAVDREALTGSAGFVDVIEQVLHETGIRSISELQNFYHTRVTGYHQHMLKVCKQYTQEYKRLRQPESKMQDEAKPIRVKEEPVSEIQFPVAEDNEEQGDEKHGSPLHLEELHGALQTETEANSTLKDEDGIKWPPSGQGCKKEVNSTPNLDPDEEIINVSDSPAPSNSEIDMVQSIPSVSVSDTLSPAMDTMRMGKPPKKKKKK